MTFDRKKADPEALMRAVETASSPLSVYKAWVLEK